jgi:AcrR family transcriptional regulator
MTADGTRRSPTAARRRNPRGQGQILREQLVAAATELLATLDSPQALTLRMVARQVGVAPASVYGHFADLGALVEHVLRHRYQELAELMARAAERASTPVEDLVGRCAAYLYWGTANPGHYRVVFGGRAPSDVFPSTAHEAGAELLAGVVSALAAASKATTAAKSAAAAGMMVTPARAALPAAGQNRLFTAWTETVHHTRAHSETGQPPLARWESRWPVPVPAPADLADAFRWSEWRTVTKTATVSMHGNRYQPRRGCPDRAARPGSLIPPAGVLPRHLLDQHHELGIARRPAAAVRISPSPADQPPVPAQHVSGVTSRPVRREQTSPDGCTAGPPVSSTVGRRYRRRYRRDMYPN